MPAAGAERLSAIGDTARAALTEMRRLLGVLREDAGAEAADRRPQPGLRLGELNELLDEARDASGTGARLILSGSPVTLDPGVELAAYRIVQEALTNARRHAPGAAVDVELHYTGDGLRLLVRDNGPGPAAAAPYAGHGLSGMRERAAAIGGELRAARPPGRFPRRGPPAGRGRDARMSGPSPAVRIVVADDHLVVRTGFAALLDTQPDFTVVATACDGAQAVRVCRELSPDVVLMDVRMPVMDGIEATRRLAGSAEAGPRVLILTTFDLDEYVYDALRAGASGFLLKDVTAERLFDAVRVIAAGEALLAPAVTRRLIGEFARLHARPGARDTAVLAALTPARRRSCGWSPRACPTRR
nr:hypothetical protein GCM10020093_016960 [Planobispora longispora]